MWLTYAGVLLLALTWNSVLATRSFSDLSTFTPPHDGQPGCGIRYEFSRSWRHNLEPENYWKCTEWQQPADLKTCPPGTRFQDSWQTCVRFSDWEWTPYSEPPTRPYEYVDECVEILLDTDDPNQGPCECPGDSTENTTIGTGTTESVDEGSSESNWTTEGVADGSTEGASTEGSWTTEDDGNGGSTEGSWTTEGGIEGTTELHWTTEDGNGASTEGSWTTEGGNQNSTESNWTTEGGNEITTSSSIPGATEETDPFGICPGADDSQHDPGTMSCYRPTCTMADWHQGILLFPSRDPSFFYQCGPGQGNIFLMPCAVGTCFSFTHQVCVNAKIWKNDCA